MIKVLLGTSKNFRISFLAVLPLLFLVALSSCNLPTFEKDAKHLAKKAGDTAGDVSREIGDTFDPETNDLIDPDIGYSREDYRKQFVNKTAPIVSDTPPNPVLPDVSSLLIEPRPPIVGKDKLVSISVTEDVPIKDVILELARRAEVDVEIDPGIAGGIILRAKNKPFSEVIERVAELTGLRYSIKNGVLKVERDTPFIVNYNISILNLVRSNQSSTSVSTSVLSGSGEGGGDGLNSGSTTEIAASYEGDVWQEMETALNNIIGNYSGQVTTYSPDAGGDLPLNDEVLAGSTPASQSGGGNSVGNGGSILAINRQSGVVSVLASGKQHREIKQYLDYILRSQSSQVLIEAKILEVNLTDEFRSGINWSQLNLSEQGITSSGDFTDTFSDTGVTEFFTLGLMGESNLGEQFDFNISAQLVEKFGVVKTLSNPRISVLNNQQAVLTFAENKIYFDVEISTDETGSGTSTETSTTVDSTPITVPIGVILSLQPSIDVENNEITMSVRPTVSRVTSTVSDPGIAAALASIGSTADIPNEVPEVEVREIDSIIRAKNGQIMVIGGLIEERIENEDVGVPGVSEVPYVGNLFKSVEKTKSIVETVIFIKATIIPGYGLDHPDKDFYRSFSTDRRPFTL